MFLHPAAKNPLIIYLNNLPLPNLFHFLSKIATELVGMLYFLKMTTG